MVKGKEYVALVGLSWPKDEDAEKRIAAGEAADDDWVEVGESATFEPPEKYRRRLIRAGYIRRATAKEVKGDG
jgi:hypothetical protein